MNPDNATIILKKMKKIRKTWYIFDFTIPFLWKNGYNKSYMKIWARLHFNIYDISMDFNAAKLPENKNVEEQVWEVSLKILLELLV